MDKIIADVLAHAAEAAPRECCGLVIARNGKQEYMRCGNAYAGVEDRFIISAEDYAAAEDRGEVVMVAHSHPYQPATPSEADRVGCESSGVPWLIVNYPNGDHTLTEPSGYRAPLIGRPFCKGVLDCYATVKDHFSIELGIELRDMVRPEVWWEVGHSILLENFEAFGFKRIEAHEMQPNDCLLMQIGASVPNHCAVYLGNDMILHHVLNRLSSRDVYGGYWRRATSHYLRYVG